MKNNQKLEKTQSL